MENYKANNSQEKDTINKVIQEALAQVGQYIKIEHKRDKQAA